MMFCLQSKKRGIHISGSEGTVYFGKVLQYRNLSVKFDFPLSLKGKVLQFFFLLINYVKSLMSSVEQLATEFSMNSSNVGQYHHARFPCAVIAAGL